MVHIMDMVDMLGRMDMVDLIDMMDMVDVVIILMPGVALDILASSVDLVSFFSKIYIE